MKETMEATQNASESLANAQLEKLKLEIEELKDRKRWADRVARYIPLFSVLITVAGFCFGVYQFRAQQADNEKKLFQNRDMEIKIGRRSKLEKQLTEFYYPISWRLKTDDIYWMQIKRQRFLTNTDNKKLVSAEKDTVLVNQDEIMRIIYTHTEVALNNPKLANQIPLFVAYVSECKSSSIFYTNMDDRLIRAKYPKEFYSVISEQISVMEKRIKECYDKLERCDDIVW
jgi:hypothetical protein